jgi:segregation and condensation protein A
VNIEDYRVRLDSFCGPLDLLLFLIRRDEIDIYDIPIAQITSQYCEYVRLMEAIDPNSVGDFLVVAATLMEVKSRMLLPTPPAEDGEEEDPRMELVRQLLEYKQYKDAAQELADRARERALRFARSPARDAPVGEIELEDVPVWELLEAFGRLMAATGRTLLPHEVVYDDTPLELYEADLVDRLEREPSLSMTAIFAGRTRAQCIGLFLALLELIRQRRVRATQDAPLGEIFLHLVPASQIPVEARSEPAEPRVNEGEALAAEHVEEAPTPPDSLSVETPETVLEVEDP